MRQEVADLQQVKRDMWNRGGACCTIQLAVDKKFTFRICCLNVHCSMVRMSVIFSVM